MAEHSSVVRENPLDSPESPAHEIERRDRPRRRWLYWTFFGLTLLTTTYAGAAHQGVNLLRHRERFNVDLPCALGLLSMLGVHELGHYFTARRYHMRVTPPLFI